MLNAFTVWQWPGVTTGNWEGTNLKSPPPFFFLDPFISRLTGLSLASPRAGNRHYGHWRRTCYLARLLEGLYAGTASAGHALGSTAGGNLAAFTSLLSSAGKASQREGPMVTLLLRRWLLGPHHNI